MSQAAIWIPKMQRICTNLLLKLNQETGQTIVIVTHNDELANMANRKLEMVDGKLIS